MIRSLLLLLVALPLLGGPRALAEAPASGAFRPTVSDLESSPAIAFPGAWRFHEGDDPSWARPDVDTSSWRLQTTALRPSESWRFRDLGWYRIRVEVPATLTGRPLALKVLSSGAGELFVDGRTAFTWGEIGGAGGTVLENPVVSRVLLLDGGPHDLAVRFANPRASEFRAAGYFAGFQLSIGLAERALQADVDKAIRGRRGSGSSRGSSSRSASSTCSSSSSSGTCARTFTSRSSVSRTRSLPTCCSAGEFPATPVSPCTPTPG